MFSQKTLKTVRDENYSDLELSSDDEEMFGNALDREPRPVRIGAEVINRRQSSSNSDDDESSSDSFDGEPDLEPESSDTSSEIEQDQTEVPSSNQDNLHNLTPKQKITCRHRELQNFKTSDWLPPIVVDPKVQTPADYYYRYIPKELFRLMAKMSNLYAVQSKTPKFKPTNTEELEVLFGLSLATRVFSYPALKMFWEANTSIPLFTENMSRNRFFELRNNLRLVDNTKLPTGCKDAFYKVRPIYDAVRNRCLELPLDKELCLDKQIVHLTGKHVTKQYLKEKSCSLGLKIFFLCSKHGQVYDFMLHQNSSPELGKTFKNKTEYGAAVVLHLTKRIGEGRGHELYFDNYFSSYHLLQILRNKGIMAACTARAYRFANPPLLSKKEINKKPRGFAQEVSSDDGTVTIVKWRDEKIAHVASNFIGIGEKDLVKRWCNKQKRYIEVERPEVVKKYNQAMAGVDLLEKLMSYYRTFIKSKKWTLRMIFHASDLAVVQAYREYQIDNDFLRIPKKRQLTLLQFRHRLAEGLVLQNKVSTAKTGPNVSESSPMPQIMPRRTGEIRPSPEIARDGVGHFPAHDDASGTRCKMLGCKGKSRVRCIKCKVHLCLTRDKNCFLTFHT